MDLRAISDEELRKEGEWLIFDGPRTPDAKDLLDVIDEMKRRGRINIQEWLDSLPTADEHKAEADRNRAEEIIQIIRSRRKDV